MLLLTLIGGAALATADAPALPFAAAAAWSAPAEPQGQPYDAELPPLSGPPPALPPTPRSATPRVMYPRAPTQTPTLPQPAAVAQDYTPAPQPLQAPRRAATGQPYALPAIPAGADDLAGCRQRLCNGQAIGRFLGQLRAGPNRPLHILQIGDSLTIGDMISNGWRVPLQQVHGSGGRGVLPPAHPFNGYISWGVTGRAEGGWSTNALFGPGYTPGGPAMGISGFTQTAIHAGATLTYTADDDANRFDKVTVCALTGPAAGRIAVDTGTMPPVTIDLAAASDGVRCDDIDTQRRAERVTITTLSEQPVSVTSVGLFRKGPGLVLSNLGVIGSQLSHQTRANDAVYAAELAHYRPDLVVLAFGTNEAFNPSLDTGVFGATLRAQVRRIRAVLGADMPILLLAPPDAATRNPAIAHPLSTDMHGCSGGLMIPSGLAAVRREEWAGARALNLAFWNAGLAMGGPCTSIDWRAQGMMIGDLVHITKSGGAVLGALLAADLEGAATNGTSGFGAAFGPGFGASLTSPEARPR